MADETKTIQPAAAPAKTKTLEYVGPKKVPVVRFPGDNNSYRANKLTDEQRQFVLDTVPEAATWWK